MFKKVALIFCLALVGCNGQAARTEVFETVPEVDDVSLVDAVRNWTLDDESQRLIDGFLAFGVSSIKPVLVVNDVSRLGNSFWSGENLEICPGTFSLLSFLKGGTNQVPLVGWVQRNGNYESGKPNPLIGFSYSISVLNDSNFTRESISTGFDAHVAAQGDTCEFQSDIWRLTQTEIDPCIVETIPGYDAECLKRAERARGSRNMGNFVSKLVYSNSNGPSIFSVTTLIPFDNAGGGFTRKLVLRKLYVLPNSDDIFEVTASFRTTDRSVSDSKWEDATVGVSDAFFSYVYDSLEMQRRFARE